MAIICLASAKVYFCDFTVPSYLFHQCIILCELKHVSKVKPSSKEVSVLESSNCRLFFFSWL